MERLLANLHDGAVKLYRRDEGDSGPIHYQLRIPGSKAYERKSTKTSDLTEATRVADQRYRELEWRNNAGLPTQVVRFADCADQYIKHLGELPAEKENSARNRASQISIIRRYLVPFLGQFEPHKINDQLMQRYHEWRIGLLAGTQEGPEITARSRQCHGTYTAYSRNMGETLVMRILRHATRTKQIAERELQPLNPTKVKVVRRGTFTEQQVVALIDHLKVREWLLRAQPRRSVKRKYERLLVELMLASGTRINEALNLTWRDVEAIRLANSQVLQLTVDGKTGPRKVICQPEAVKIIEELKVLATDKSRTAKVSQDTRRCLVT